MICGLRALGTCYRARWWRRQQRRMPKINICCQLFIDTQNRRTKKARVPPEFAAPQQYTLLAAGWCFGANKRQFRPTRSDTRASNTLREQLTVGRSEWNSFEPGSAPAEATSIVRYRGIKFSQHAKHNWFLTEIRLGRNICRVSCDAALWKMI